MADEPFEAQRVDPVSALAAGWRAFTRRYPAMLAAWAPVVAVQVAAGLLLVAYASAIGFPLAEFDAGASTADVGRMMQFLGLGLPLLFASSVATLAGWGLVARIVQRDVDPEAARAPVPWGMLLGLGAALALVYAAGILLLLVGFLVFLHWFLYAPAALVDRRRGVGDALEESRRFAKARRTYGFTALVALLYVGIFVVAALLNALLLAGADAAGAPRELAETVTSPLSTWLLAPLLPALPAAYWALAQRAPGAGEAEPAPEDAGAAAPGAARFRTTKCPQCGTLVPYTATGQPVDVTCPVCGRAGRVL
jgi:hypothetical protein